MGEKKKRITVSVTNDLITDQRVHKVCTSLKNAGYDVLLIGRKLRKSPEIDREYKTRRMYLVFNRSFFFYAEYNIRLFFRLLFSKTDMLLSNDTDTLPANFLVSKIRRKPLIFDAHEMFPEVPELVDRKFVKQFWTKIEDWIFPKLNYSYTVCRSIADIYNSQYGIDMKVVRNIPFASNDKKEDGSNDISREKNELFPEHNNKYILLYQGAVNIGRGIERIISAMPYLDEYIFYIAGDGDKMQYLQKLVTEKNVSDRVKFLGRIPFERLPAYTSCADIGISLLENWGLNYFYSLPNRIFDFIRKNIPILATDFPEIRNIIACYEIGKLTDDYDPAHLAVLIRDMTAKGKNLEGFAKANVELTWENEANILLKLVAEAATGY
jgi:glycosyltransferase involved in cell wall biosynthesis